MKHSIVSCVSGILALLAKYGADMDARVNDTMTSLLLVSQSRLPIFGDDSRITTTAQMLLEHGASVNVRNKYGLTPLHLASHHGLSEIVEFLLKFAADVDARASSKQYYPVAFCRLISILMLISHVVL